MIKVKVELAPFRKYKDKCIEVYEKHGFRRMQEYCVVSGIHLVAMYTIVLESIESEEMQESLDELIEFYNCEVVE